MPKFAPASLTQLLTCHEDLQTLFNEVVEHFDCTVLEGHRNEQNQHKAFKEGKSKLDWPHGKHNAIPSLAVDVAPYDIQLKVDWNDVSRFYYFSGFVKGIAWYLKSTGKITHEIRWGGDWDNDTETKDQKFNDLVHFELIMP